jgi:hypothetical protein
MGGTCSASPEANTSRTTGRRWNVRKKKASPSKIDISPGVSKIFVGKGITCRSGVVLSFPEAASEAPKYLAGDYSFEGRIAVLERGAKKILEDAGLPSDPAAEVRYKRDGIEWRGQALGAVADEERLTLKWYAAKFLNELRITRAAIERGEAALAANLALTLGELATEVRIQFGFFAQTGASGGKKKRRYPPIGAFVLSLVKSSRNGTARDIWETIPTDQVDGIRFRGYKFYRNGIRLLAVGKVDGCKDWRPVGKPLKYSAFRSRVTDARKTLAR